MGVPIVPSWFIVGFCRHFPIEIYRNGLPFAEKNCPPRIGLQDSGTNGTVAAATPGSEAELAPDQARGELVLYMKRYENKQNSWTQMYMVISLSPYVDLFNIYIIIHIYLHICIF